MTPVWLSSWRRSERVSAKKVENLVQRTGAAPPPAPLTGAALSRRPWAAPLGLAGAGAPPLWGLECVREETG